MRKKVANPLGDVYASGEIERKWALKEGTVRQDCTRGKLKKHVGRGVKQSGKVWVAHESILRKVYGDPKEEKQMYDKYWFIYCDKRDEGPGLGKSHEEGTEAVRKAMVSDGYSETEIKPVIERLNDDYQKFIREDY